MKYYECICYNVWYLAIINDLHKLMVNTKIHAPSMYTSYYAYLRSCHTYAPCTLCTSYSLCTGTVHPWSNHKTPLAYSARTTRCLILTLDGCTCSTPYSAPRFVWSLCCTYCMCLLHVFQILCIGQKVGLLRKGIKLLDPGYKKEWSTDTKYPVVFLSHDMAIYSGRVNGPPYIPYTLCHVLLMWPSRIAICSFLLLGNLDLNLFKSIIILLVVCFPFILPSVYNRVGCMSLDSR